MFARWLMEAGQSIVQILPIHEMPPIETSPYSAMTAMALDPIYITMASVADFSGLGAEHALDGAEQAEIRRLQQSPRIEYASIRRLKDRWLRRSFDRFLRLEVSRGTPRAARFDAFVAAQSWWLDEYALFRAISALHETSPWTLWPEPLARADAAAVAEARGVAATGDHLPVLPAMDRGRAMVGGQTAVVAVAGVRRSAVHDLREQSRRVGAAGRVPV